MRIGICEFKKPVNFKNGYIAEVMLPLTENPVVQITDVAKDNWQLPCIVLDLGGNYIGESVDVGNPKLKKMSLDDFHKTFKITHERVIGSPNKIYTE